MKPKSNKWPIALVSFGLFLSSCGAGELNKKAEISATDFYTDLQKKDYAAALSVCSDKAFTEDSKEEWIKQFKRNSVLLGDVKSFTKTSGFNISASTSQGTTVTIAYDVQWQHGKSQDSIMLIKDKDGNMRVYRYVWKHKDAKYLLEVEESEKETVQYMDAIKSSDYDAALALCSEEAFKITPKVNWVFFLDNAKTKLGPLANYQVIKDSSSYNIEADGQSGPGNYYDIFVKSNRGGNEVMEKVVFFQKGYDAPLRLAGHSFL